MTQYPGLRIPQQCPLHPSRDYHGQAELSKLHYRVNLWTCSQCGKSFNREDSLENHIAARHTTINSQIDVSTCLADLCDILRCDTQTAVKRRPWLYRDQKNMNSFQVARAPSKELVALLENSDSLSTKKNIDSCTTPRKFSSTILRSQDAFFCPECNTSTYRCDKNKMLEIKRKCEKLIDVCVNQLVLMLTDLQFKELRDRLSNRVCWFLTCERYWENKLKNSQKDLIIIFYVIYVFFAFFFVTSYSIIWIYF